MKDSNIDILINIKAEGEKMLKNLNDTLKSFIKYLDSAEEISRNLNYSYILNKTLELKNRIENLELHVVVIGQFKRGKTTLLNYFIGEELLPTGVVPITSIITKLRYGETAKANITFEDETHKAIDINIISKYISEQENPENVKKVDNIEVLFPSSLLEKGLVLIDTPGIGSIYKHNTQVAYDYLSEADAAIFLISSDAPIGEVEIDFLNQVKKHIKKIFFVQNKIDYLSEEDRAESLSFSEEAIYKVIKTRPMIHPISAKLAYEGRTENNFEKIHKSGIAVFESALESFLIKDKGDFLVKNYENKITSLLNSINEYVEFNRDLLNSKIETLDEKLNIFNVKIKDTETMKREALAIIEAELENILEAFSMDLNGFREKQIGVIESKLKKIASDNENSTSKELFELLNEHLENEVENSYIQWNKDQELKIKESYESILSRFTDKLNEIVDQINNITYSLFKIHIGQPIEEFQLIDRDSFYFQFKRVGATYLTPSANDLLFLLPRGIRNKKILSDSIKRAEKELEKNGNNLKWDYTCKIRDSKYIFQGAFTDYIQSIKSDLETTIKKVKDLKMEKSSEIEEKLELYNKMSKQAQDLICKLENEKINNS